MTSSFFKLTKYTTWGVLKSMSFGITTFFIFCVLALSGAMCLTLMAKQPEGIEKGLAFFNNQEKTSKKIQNVLIEQSNRSSESSPSRSKSSEEIAQQKTLLKQAQEIAEVITPKEKPVSAWLFRLSQEKILSHPIKVKIRPYRLTSEQERILKIQGIRVSEWKNNEAPPPRVDKISERMIWIAQRNQKEWLIYGTMADLLEENKVQRDVLTNLDIIRMIMWAEEYKKQDEWERTNPAPTPPSDIQPSNIAINIIPNTASLAVAFWVGVGFLGLFVSLPALLLTLSSWENMRREGNFEAVSSLPVSATFFVGVFIFARSALLFMAILCSALISVIALKMLGVRVVAKDVLSIVVIVWSMSFLAQCVGMTILLWYPKRWWRVWMLIVMAVTGLVAEGLYIVAFTNSRILAQYFQGWAMVGLSVVIILLSLGMWKICGYRLEREGRLGFRAF